MSDTLNHVRVWSAMRDQPRGIINYDRLAKAGLPGQIVLNNIMGRIIDSARFVNRERVEAFDERHAEVKLGRGGTQSYVPGGFLLGESVGLTVMLADPEFKLPHVMAALSYRLTNEREADKWKTSTKFDSDGMESNDIQYVFGQFSGDCSDMENLVPWDFQRALNDPVKFVTEAAGQAIGATALAQIPLFERVPLLGQLNAAEAAIAQ